PDQLKIVRLRERSDFGSGWRECPWTLPFMAGASRKADKSARTALKLRNCTRSPRFGNRIPLNTSDALRFGGSRELILLSLALASTKTEILGSVSFQSVKRF